MNNVNKCRAGEAYAADAIKSHSTRTATCSLKIYEDTDIMFTDARGCDPNAPLTWWRLTLSQLQSVLHINAAVYLQMLPSNDDDPRLIHMTSPFVMASEKTLHHFGSVFRDSLARDPDYPILFKRSELRMVVQGKKVRVFLNDRCDDFKRTIWKDTFGVQYPQAKSDWLQLSVRFGVSVETTIATPLKDLIGCTQGLLLRRIDEQMRTMPATPEPEPTTPPPPSPVGERDADGFVVKPPDSAAYVSMTEILTNCPVESGLTMRRLGTILGQNRDSIRQWKPSPQRRMIHRGDWERFAQTQSAKNDDWAPPAEAEQRKVALKAEKARRK